MIRQVQKTAGFFSDPIKLVLISAAANGLITWGVVSTKLDWQRRDIDRNDVRISIIENRLQIEALKASNK